MSPPEDSLGTATPYSKEARKGKRESKDQGKEGSRCRGRGEGVRAGKVTALVYV